MATGCAEQDPYVVSADSETARARAQAPTVRCRVLGVADSEHASICLNEADLADEVDMSVNLT